MLISKIIKSLAFIGITFLSTFLPSELIFPQKLTELQLDSLYKKFLQLTSPDLLLQSDVTEELTNEDRKCGFNIVNQIKLSFENYNPEQQTILKTLVARPVMQKSIVSPSGFFRIHFDTTNINNNGIPSYFVGTIEQNVAEVANALDSAYRFEIDFLGFLPPPSDDINGGDDKYDIYIKNQSAGLYGYTEWETKVGSINWTSFVVVDNDYPASQFFSAGLDGMRVTVAHEFHHGIQLGNYSVQNGSSPFRNSDVFFYELTSTSMEEFVYDDVNDYYAYMDSYFRRTYLAMPSQNGYNLAIWNLFMQENFGFEILNHQWEMIPNIEAILAINQSLIGENTSFPKQLNKFGIWTYFTGVRSVPGNYFEEAVNYPSVDPTFTILFPSPPPGDMEAAPTSNNFLLFNIPLNSDSLFAIITNGDAFAASDNPGQQFPFDYVLYADSISGSRKLTENYSSDFSVSDPMFWSVSEILNDQVVREDSLQIPIAGEVNYAYPNPFSYNKSYLTGPLIFLPFDSNAGDEVDLNVYSTGMQLVFSSIKIIQNLPGNQKGVSWNALDSDGEKLASGVYVYVIKNGDEIEKGKIVIFNE